MILAIETSDVICSVAFWDEENKRTLFESTMEIPMQHATLLSVFVENGINFIDKRIKELISFKREISLVAVSVGPGSFTGLRIGLSFAQGYCFAKNIPIVGISNHQILAFQATPSERQLFSIIDARREEVYFARLKFDKDGLPEIEEHRLVFKDKLPEVIPSGAVIVKPSFHSLDADILQKFQVKGVSVHHKGLYLSRFLAEIGYKKFLKSGADDLKTIEPMYIRPFAGVL